MKNTPPVSEPVSPLIWKLTMMGGGILVMVLLVFATRSIVGVLRSSSSSPATMQTNTETVGVQPKPSVETPPLSVPNNSQAASSSSSRPTTLAVQNEISEQREKARAETIEALKRQAQEQAGPSGVSKEELKKLEQFDSYIQ